MPIPTPTVSDAFRTAWGEKFLSQGGKELLFEGTVEALDTLSFTTADDLLAFLSKASLPASLTDLVNETVLAAYAGPATKTAASPIGENGKPRMLRLSAWIAHEGYANGNGDRFPDGELKTAVGNGLFQAPYFGMVDYNHDFTAYGVWHEAKYAFDKKANAYGILAEGVMFAWRYTDHADKILAAQARDGVVKFSAAWMPRDLKVVQDATGRSVYDNYAPVFFATSFLDVPPADVFGDGQGTENLDVSTEAQTEAVMNRASSAAELSAENAEKLIAAIAEQAKKSATAADATQSDLTSDTAPDATPESPAGATDSLPETHMTIAELIAEFRRVVAEEQAAQFAPMVEAFTTLPAVTEALETAQADLVTAQARVAELEAVEAARDEAVLAREAAEQALAAQTEELAAFREASRLADEQAAAAALVARREARLNELCAEARTALNSRDAETQERLVSRWVGMDDEEWGMTRDTLNIARANAAPNKYETATTTEGPLAPGGAPTAKKYAIDEFVK